MTTETHNSRRPNPGPAGDGAEIIPFRRPSAPDSAPVQTPEPDDLPDDDGPSAA